MSAGANVTGADHRMRVDATPSGFVKGEVPGGACWARASRWSGGGGARFEDAVHAARVGDIKDAAVVVDAERGGAVGAVVVVGDDAEAGGEVGERARAVHADDTVEAGVEQV